jgi:Tle cognate immunity protein 4 C-terminal domain
VHQPTKTIYGGRFRLEVPIEFTSRGDGGYLKDVQLTGVTLPPAPSLAAARDAFWKGHVVDVRRQGRAHELPPILDEGELRPGVPQLVYLGYAEVDLAHEALLTDPGRGVIVKAAWRESYKPEDRPAENAERLRALNEVVSAFSFLPPDYAAADPAAFYIKGGMVRLPYTASNEEHEERYATGFNGKTQGMEVFFKYEYREHTVANQPGLLERTASAIAEWAFDGRSVRSRHRVVGGFSGEESVLHAPKEHELTFRWMYEPAPSAAGFQPSITIDAESEDGDIPTVLALWDQILDGVQRLVP